MIHLNSKESKELEIALNEAFETGNCENWKRALNDEDKAYLDGFLIFMSHKKSSSLLKELGFESLDDWFLNLDSWREKALDPRSDPQERELIIYHLWDSLSKRIISLLRYSRLNSNIPRVGGILLYIGGLSKCIIIKYNIIGELPKYQVIDVIDKPQSAFDFWGTITEAKMKDKNSLKEIISTGHKIIVHRGILIHVDRRKDIEVFGPSIDTLVLAEMLAQKIYESPDSNCKRALEIGCGNGLITISLAKYCPNLELLQSIDINFNALICTNRNLNGNVRLFLLKKKDLFLTAGHFNPNFFSSKFDLIVCNPPYIPTLQGGLKPLESQSTFFQAIGGLDLIEATLKSIKKILSHNGKLLLMASNLSLEYTLDNIPKYCKYSLPFKDGFKVLFDVESVLNEVKWLEFLKNDCGLIEENGVFYHKLFPIWIEFEDAVKDV
jgi:methylase of polypeptide subunit release factors